MVLRPARFFITGSVVFGGLMAGADIDRYMVQVPAWNHLHVEAWAAYSRNADLLNGRILYPILGIGLALFAICAVASFFRDKQMPKTAATPLFLAAAFAILGMVATAFAAPIMLSLPLLGEEHAALQLAFSKFHFWGLLRIVVQVLAFGASVWAMALTSKESKSI